MPMSVVLAPDAFVAVWKRFWKPAPVVFVPVFAMVEESVTAVPVVAVVGVMEEAVRSGCPVGVEVQVVAPAAIQELWVASNMREPP